MIGQPRHIPVSIWPGDWCLHCKDPDHSKLEMCNMLTVRKTEGGLDYMPCGCKDSLVLGVQGQYLIAVTEMQHE